MSSLSPTHMDTVFGHVSLIFTSARRHQTSLYWSLDGQHRKRWPCWRQSWTVVLETGWCFVSFVIQLQTEESLNQSVYRFTTTFMFACTENDIPHNLQEVFFFQLFILPQFILSSAIFQSSVHVVTSSEFVTGFMSYCFFLEHVYYRT